MKIRNIIYLFTLSLAGVSIVNAGTYCSAKVDADSTAVALTYDHLFSSSSSSSSGTTYWRLKNKAGSGAKYLTGKDANNSTANKSKVTRQNLNTNWGTQQWEFKNLGGTERRIVNKSSGRYLTGKDANNSTANKAAVTSQNLNTNWGTQKWDNLDAGSGFRRFRNKSSGRYLTGKDANNNLGNKTTVTIQNLNTNWGTQQWETLQVN